MDEADQASYLDGGLLEALPAMRLLVINPNTTASMTAKIGEAAKAVAAPGTSIAAVNPDFGPASIEGYFDEIFAMPGIIAEMNKAGAVDAYVIACFDDTGLDAARCLTAAPVIGIGEAGFHMASLVAGRFSVVTTLARSVPAISHNLEKYGLKSRCAKVRASDVPVLELELPGSDARKRISDEIGRALREDGAEAIVLGCAGMADLAAALTAEHGVPVIDGVACAVKLCEALVGLGLQTSKTGGYAAPRAKAYSGMFARFSPNGSAPGG
jgi:allantoin racemase